MKKQIFIGALALITLAACQNEREDITQDNSEIAINVVKNDAKGQSARAGIPKDESLEPSPATINCHTDYSNETGNACVYNGGYLFNVTWKTELVPFGTSGQVIATRVYTSTSVNSCNCG